MAEIPKYISQEDAAEMAGSGPARRYVPQNARMSPRFPAAQVVAMDTDMLLPPAAPLSPLTRGDVRESSPSASPFLGAQKALMSNLDAVNLSEERPEGQQALWDVTKRYLSRKPEKIVQQIADHVEFSLARSEYNMDDETLYHATALSVRDRMIEHWNDTQQFFNDKKVKRMYYMSFEYLMGRYLRNCLCNTSLTDRYAKALNKIGCALEDLYDEEQDAALGSGGLGRLAACFLDSLATLDMPAWGYGLRYEFGMFKQVIINGQQSEVPEYWLKNGNPWEIPRTDVTYKVQFGGSVNCIRRSDGEGVRYRWDSNHTVVATAYDTPIPGYDTLNTINLRLWAASPATVFDLEQFNREDQHPDYWATLNQRQKDENITKVLYPQTTPKGQELRLKQQYFFVSATLQDIMRRFKNMDLPFSEFPNYSAIQLNDTHPTLAVAELMRLLVDIEDLGWDEAWDITTKTFAYTNHTILPEALETWPVPMFSYLLPRHLQIIYEINQKFLDMVRTISEQNARTHSGPVFTTEQIIRMSIIEESCPKRVRMANLAIVGSHKVNGVAAIHSQILKDDVFHDFYLLWPDKFINVTNGVTPRRWLLQCNPRLSQVITDTIERPEWPTKLDLLSNLKKNITPELIKKFQEAKLANKEVLRKKILELTDGKVDVDPRAMFDVHVKRIHEYKRQLLNILGVIHRYLTILDTPVEKRGDIVPKVVIFAGKAAAGYEMAKLIIRLIVAVSEKVNNDPNVGNLLKVVFIPNYSVSKAEYIVPATDLSEQISTAGTEASGTGNMKFVMNGALILGTLDGANIEIMENVGRENIFIFGAEKDEVYEIRRSPPRAIDERLYRVLRAIQTGRFSHSGENYNALIDPIFRGNDYYAVAHDFPLFVDAQAKVDEMWKKPDEWTTMCIRNVSMTGFFSSDRTIQEYVDKVWKITPTRLPLPSAK